MIWSSSLTAIDWRSPSVFVARMERSLAKSIDHRYGSEDLPPDLLETTRLVEQLGCPRSSSTRP